MNCVTSLHPTCSSTSTRYHRSAVGTALRSDRRTTGAGLRLLEPVAGRVGGESAIEPRAPSNMDRLATSGMPPAAEAESIGPLAATPLTSAPPSGSGHRELINTIGSAFGLHTEKT